MLGREVSSVFCWLFEGSNLQPQHWPGWVTAAQPRRHKKHKQPAGVSGFGLRGFESYHAWKEPPTARQCLALPHTPAAQTQREGEYHRKRFLLEHSCFEWQNNKNNNSNSKNVQMRGKKKIPQKT